MHLAPAVLLLLHLLAAAWWVAGMAVMHLAVRPAAVATLPPPLRLPFMTAALGRFFAGVSLAVVLLLASGFAMIVPAGAKHNVINTGDKLMRLYTLYAPPEHVDGVIALTRADAEALHEHFDGKTTE